MNKKLLPALIALGFSAAASAEVDVYGKLQMTLQNSDIDQTVLGAAIEDSSAELKNHSSRLGFKGSEETESGLTAIYQYELGINPDDNTTWTQRNAFLGFKGGFGTIKGGHYDTAMKSSQGKVNVFGDFDGDMQGIITLNDVRKSNTVSYITPNLNGFSLNASYIMPEVEDGDAGISIAGSYTGESLYVALAYDDGVALSEDGIDSSSIRGTVTYQLGSVQLGGMYETFEIDEADFEEAGWLVSGKWGASPKWDLKVEYGTSDIIYEGGQLASVGADYKVNKNLKFMGYFTSKQDDSEEGDALTIDNTYVALGTVLKF